MNKRQLIVEDVNVGIVINDIFNEWNSIKNESDSNAWKTKILDFKAGTYNQFNLLEMINALKEESKTETYLEKTFKEELSKILKPNEPRKTNIKRHK